MAGLVRISRIVAIALGVMAAAATRTEAQESPNPLSNCDPQRSSMRFNFDGENFVAGEVRLICDDTQIYADEIRWNEKTMTAIGEGGRLLVIQDGLRVNASRVEMDRKTRLGVFYDVYGTARLTDQPTSGSPFGALEAEVMFTAE
jgi:hypothetical protein